jgi:hypothetical protein
MGIEWWEIVVALGVAGGLLWMNSRKPAELGLNTRPAVPGLRFALQGGETAPVDEELKEAHKHSSKHRAELESSEQCGCFYCGRRFSPAEITEWTDDGQTALCPHCGIDAVIGSAAGFELTREFLGKMNDSWFSV